MRLADRLVAAWYAPRPTALSLLLAPLALLFAAVVALRCALYRAGILKAERLPATVVVIGNITAGGSGKTPLVAALARMLEERGFHPGVVSRGHGRNGHDGTPLLVTAETDAALSGDEPLLLARAGLRVAVARDRVAAARALLAAHPACNVIIADDGLQHYRLARDFEIAVVDAARGLGNGCPLPAGPLREPRSRLDQVDAIVALVTAGASAPRLIPNAYRMTLDGAIFRRVDGAAVESPATAFTGAGVHALAGIGNPQRFFDHLASLGIRPATHALPDHHRFVASDLALPGARAILMTEKDAVKCRALADARCWYLPVRAHVDAALFERVLESLRGSEAA
jgi:tetraacyldisaccharide 4'-kinase